MNWFYEAGGKQQGPISEAELDRLVAAGTITPATLVWREGLPDWQPLAMARPAASAGEAVRCASCSRLFPASEVIMIGSRWICSECKPAVLQGLQQGSDLPLVGEEDRTGPSWERRETLGFFPAIWETIVEVLIKPVETFATMKREGGINSPLLYAVLMGTVGGLANILYQFASRMVLPRQQYPPELAPYMQMIETPIALLVGAVLLPIFVTLYTFVLSGITHLCLMLCGGATRPFETTYRVCCYSYGSSMSLQLIPFCGGAVAWIWGVVCICIGLAKAHEIDTWRAVLAVLLPLFLCCGLGVAMVAAVIAMVGGMAR
jgi:hypothetical protein